MNISIPITSKVAGYYRVRVLDANSICHTDTGWFKNLITDTGMDQLGSSTNEYNNGLSTCVMSRCGVGTGNTTPSVTDTSLTSPLAMYPGVSIAGFNNSNYTRTYVSGPPAYWSCLVVFPFPIGTVVGNIAEVGTGGITSGALTTPILATHALIVDSGGVPTTISVTSSDQLEVSFELRYYVDLTDTPYSVTISGNSYTGVIRRATVNSNSNFYPMLQVDRYSKGSSPTGECRVYNGSIGAVTASPSGSFSDITSAVMTAYTSGTYYKTATFSATTAQGNVAGGISAIRVQFQHGLWQLSVSPALPKDATKIMSLVFNVSWARYP